MLSRLMGDLRWRWAKYRLANADVWSGGGMWSVPADDRFREAIAGKLRLAPYERLAAVWHEHSLGGSPPYERFLTAIRRRFDAAIADVLDVACGVGTLTRELARDCRRVVGIDCNPHMLAEARKNCAPHAHVQIAEADFRSFSLGETFDAAICAFDSINYLDNVQELNDVLRMVAGHLRPGGFFVFDALAEAAMQSLVRVDSHSTHKDLRCAMCSYYDEPTRKSRTLVVFSDGVEEHVRVPIDPPEVSAAADRAGLVLLEVFWSANRFRTFCLLRKPAS
jgi:SAM-dependent methyltransferase